jgi:hypothetical protein
MNPDFGPDPAEKNQAVGRDRRQAASGSDLPESKVEGCAFARFAFRPYASAVAMNDALHGGEADSKAPEFLVGMKAMERQEHHLGAGGIKADTVIADEEDGAAVLFK